MSQLSKSFVVVLLALLVLAPPSADAQQNSGPSGGKSPPAGERDRRRGENRRNRERNGEAGKGEERESPRPAADTKPLAATSTGMGEKSEADKADSYAADTIKKYDKNGDNMIQKNEQEGMSSMTQKADTNGDHVITKNELIALSMGRTTSTPAAAPSTPPASGSSPASSSTATASASSNTASEAESKSHSTESKSYSKSTTASKARKSYRFKPAKERLPSSLPSWFASKDANGDAQVSMSEYNKSWNDRTAAEFQKYDHDNDGVITAAEAKDAK